MTRPLNVSKFIFNIFWSFSPSMTIMRVISYSFTSLDPLINAYIVAVLIDQIIIAIETSDTSNIQNILLAVGVVLLVQRLFRTLDKVAEKAFDQVVRFQPKILMYQKLNRLAVKDLENPEVQNRVSRFNESIYQFKIFFETILLLISIVITISISVVALGVILPGIVILLLLINIPIVMINSHFLKENFNLKVSSTTERRSTNILVGNLLDGNKFKEVKINNAFEYIKQRFESFNRDFYNKFINIRIRWNSFLLPVYIVELGIRLLGMWLVIQLALGGEITIGNIAFYFGVITSLSFNIRWLANQITNLRDSSIQIEDIYELFNYEEKSQADFSRISFDTSPEINISNINFKYPGSDQYIFKDLSLDIKSKEKIAIVGANGAGKSTLVKLIAGIYKPNSGDIMIDGISTKEIDDDDWFRSLAFLFQDFNTYESLSVKDNIAIGDTEKPLDIELMKESAKMSDAIEFINKYPSNFDQILSEKFKGGIRPSGGQWQKIAIARFFYRNSPVLILDETTSAIDAIAEANIFDRIYDYVNDKTVIIVSHRFSTVRKADRIIVLDDGKIIETGTHSELLELKGKYYQMFITQAEGYK